MPVLFKAFLNKSCEAVIKVYGISEKVRVYLTILEKLSDFKCIEENQTHQNLQNKKLDKKNKTN